MQKGLRKRSGESLMHKGMRLFGAKIPYEKKGQNQWKQ
jgi:hypothetical protein